MSMLEFLFLRVFFLFITVINGCSSFLIIVAVSYICGIGVCFCICCCVSRVPDVCVFRIIYCSSSDVCRSSSDLCWGSSFDMYSKLCSWFCGTGAFLVIGSFVSGGVGLVFG